MTKHWKEHSPTNYTHKSGSCLYQNGHNGNWWLTSGFGTDIIMYNKKPDFAELDEHIMGWLFERVYELTISVKELDKDHHRHNDDNYY